MRNRTITIILMCLPLVFFNGCEKADEFLEIDPIASTVTGAFYTNMEEGEQAVTAAYSMFNSVAVWDRNLLGVFGNMASDDAETGGAYADEVPDLEVFNRMTHQPTSDLTLEVYGCLFRGIYLSNLALENLPRILTLDSDADPKIIEIRTGEMHFIRAINYFYLTIVFGEVPLVDRTIGPSEYEMGKSTFRELYDLIESDLKKAIDVLPTRGQMSSDDIGRASKGAAKALLSRLYLYESSYAKNYPNLSRFDGLTERWDEALEYAEDVINSNDYELVGINGETYNTWRGPNTNGYRYIFTTDGDNSPETIFEIQCVQEGLGWVDARGSSLAQWFSSRHYLTESGSVSDTEYWGLNWPNQSLVDAFEDGDPRLHTAIAMEGDSIQIRGSNWVPIYFGNTETGYYTRKFEASSEEFADISGAWHSSPLNIKLIRYAEVYLNAAEAAFMNGQEAQALGFINKVRERARNSGNSGNPADLASISLEDIMNERRVELSLEGHRFFDLVRWGIAQEKITRTTPDGFDVVFDSPKHLFFPLPQREVDVTRGALVQYEGW